MSSRWEWVWSLSPRAMVCVVSAGSTLPVRGRRGPGTGVQGEVGEYCITCSNQLYDITHKHTSTFSWLFSLDNFSTLSSYIRTVCKNREYGPTPHRAVTPTHTPTHPHTHPHLPPTHTQRSMCNTQQGGSCCLLQNGNKCVRVCSLQLPAELTRGHP